jgi:hypothetical protein
MRTHVTACRSVPCVGHALDRRLYFETLETFQDTLVCHWHVQICRLGLTGVPAFVVNAVVSGWIVWQAYVTPPASVTVIFGVGMVYLLLFNSRFTRHLVSRSYRVVEVSPLPSKWHPLLFYFFLSLCAVKQNHLLHVMLWRRRPLSPLDLVDCTSAHYIRRTYVYPASKMWFGKCISVRRQTLWEVSYLHVSVYQARGCDTLR